MIALSENDPQADGGLPSAPFVPHSPIAPGACLGRAAERSTLAAWAASKDPLLVLDGPGGIGKTALAWRWFTIEAPGQIADLAGSIWWDAAESDGSPDRFVRRALAYVTSAPPESLDNRPLAACQAELLAELRRRPYLIVLDSAERLLGAYYRMDAPYLTEDKVAQEAASGDPRPRRCADPEHGALLVHLAACAPSRTLVVARLVPADLQHADGRPRAGVRNLSLGALTPDDAHSLLSGLGVRGSQEAFVQVAALADHHPFLLRLIAADVRARSNGILDRWAVDVGRDFARFAPLLRRPALARAALDNLLPDARRVLNQLAGFRFSVPLDALAVASPLAPPLPPRAPEPRRWQAGYAEAKAAWDAYRDALRERELAARAELPRLGAALDALDEAALLRRDPDRDRYDLHPLVRGYAYAFLEAAELEDIFARIRLYCETQSGHNGEAAAARALADIRPRVEVYHALISAGRLDEAAEYYRAALGRALLSRIATPHQIIELLRPLFPGGPGTLPALSNPRDQGYFANELAQALGLVGRAPEALALLGASLSAFVKTRHAPSLCATLIHYAGLLRDDRQIAAKLRVFELAHDLAAAADDQETLAIARLFLLKHSVDTGQWDGAEAAYRAFIAMPAAQRTAARQATAERLYAKMLVGQGKDATMALNLALELATESRAAHEERSVYALWGELGLLQDRPDAAAQFFLKALNMSGHDPQLAANYAGGLARALAAMGRLDEARALAERGVSRHAAAAVYLALGDAKKAAHNAIEAYEMAWADGPPFAFWWELQQARKVLAALGVPEPDLEPFDESAVRPIPFENEIRAFIEELSGKK